MKTRNDCFIFKVKVLLQRASCFLEILTIFQSNLTPEGDFMANALYIAWSDNFHIGFKNLIVFAVAI